MFKRGNGQIAGLATKIEELKDQVASLMAQRKRLQRATEVEDEINGLKKELVQVEIQRDKQREDHAREERELKHMIGLEKKRQEFETDHSKRDAVLTVREENLATDRNRFEEQMKFNTDRFKEEVVYLKDMVGQVLDRLPKVTVDHVSGVREDD